LHERPELAELVRHRRPDIKIVGLFGGLIFGLSRLVMLRASQSFSAT